MSNSIEKVNRALEAINKVILGKEDAIKEIMVTLISGGNVLLEDIPGVGKTTIALAFAKVLGLDYKRIQFTPDVMPSDLTGFSMYRRDINKFTFQRGSLFCNLVLADEINRTSPKTQSALLEAMEEHKVTVDGNTYELPKPFIVIATQNTVGEVGTQPLPSTQTDRFMSSLSIGYPDFDSEIMMAKTISIDGRTSNLENQISKEEFIEIQREIYNVYIDDKIYKYIVDLIRATREDDYIQRGASPRAVISLVQLCKSRAWLDNREYVVPADVVEQFKYVVKHRIILSTNAKLNNTTKDTVIDNILKSVEKPRI